MALCASACVYPQEQKPAKSSSSPSASSEGEQLFATNCAGCHGLDGHGGERAPDIVGRREVQKLSDAALKRIVGEGIPGTGMPSFRSLGEPKVQAVVHQLRALQGVISSEALPGSPEAGKNLFFGKAACSRCHMLNGRGGFMASDLSSYGHERSADEIREAIQNPNTQTAGKLVVVTTAAGETLIGVARNEDNFSLQLQTEDGVFHFLEKSKLRKLDRKSGSLMPDDYASRLNRQEIDDIVSYLMSSGPNSESQTKTKRAAKGDEDQE